METACTKCYTCELTYKTFLPFWQNLGTLCVLKKKKGPNPADYVSLDSVFGIQIWQETLLNQIKSMDMTDGLV